MHVTRPARLIVVIFAALAMTVFIGARGLLAQDAPVADSTTTSTSAGTDATAGADAGASSDPSASSDASASTDPSTSADASSGADAIWEPAGSATNPAIDEDAETADKVLEIPQVACAKDDPPASCDSANADNDDDGSSAINAPSPGAPPTTLDDDTTSSAAAPDDWGNAEDYQNQEISAVPYAAPYAVYPYAMTGGGTTGGTSVPSTAYVPMSSPLTAAARPPLNPGPWMLSPSRSMYMRPAGSPMMGMAFGFHHH
jgi:hypothetical protein